VAIFLKPLVLEKLVPPLYPLTTFYSIYSVIPMIWPFNRRFRKQIARIEVKGAIGSDTRKRVLENLKIIAERKFPALLLRIDSPGGTVGDSQEIFNGLKELRIKHKVKIIASFGNISASGGVYISMGADHIVANPGTITGSIGVILRGNNLEGLLAKIGISFKVIKSGPYKDILAFDRELTDPEKQILQELIDTSYQQFVLTVAESRNLSEESVRCFADGRIFTGQQALALGVVDQLGTEEDARRLAAEMVGLDPQKTPVFNFEERKPLWNRVIPGAILRPWSHGIQWLQFEIATSGLPLWLYRP
jgi:protease IV